MASSKMTSKQYLMLGEDPPGVRLELAHGEIRVTPGQTATHSSVMIALGMILNDEVERLGLGRLFLNTDVVFDDHNTRRPDIAFYSTARRHLVGGQMLIGPPDLCVEIALPWSQDTDRVEKFSMYAEWGVADYWIVDPEERSLEGFTLRSDRYEGVGAGRGSDIMRLTPFEELKIPLLELWRQT